MTKADPVARVSREGAGETEGVEVSRTAASTARAAVPGFSRRSPAPIAPRHAWNSSRWRGDGPPPTANVLVKSPR